MHKLSTTRTAALLLAVVIVTAGCGARATGSVGLPSDRSTEAPTASSTTSTTIAEAPGGEPTKSVGPDKTPPISSPATTAPIGALAPGIVVGDVDSMIDGVDETLAGLDQLLNQVAAAMAAEEGEIIP